MAEERVEVIGHVNAEPGAVWSVAGDFCGLWHPVMETIRAERDDKGRLVRAFTAKGEDTVYRERLTYRSDSDRVLAYEHIDGIAGADHYSARIAVLAAEGGGSTIHWSARIIAEASRAKSIADGTRTIFEMGIAALEQILSVETVRIEGEPQLSVTATHEKPGPLLVFLHGIGGGRMNWLRQLQAVAPHIRAAALDLRGYGESRLGACQSTIDDYCADILRVAKQFGAEKLILCGLSYGSWIATSFAMRHPEKLAGLVLSGGCTGMSEAGVEEREAFRRSREVPLSQGKTPADFAPAVVNVLAGPHASDAVREELRASMAAIPSATYRDALTCFTHPPERFDFSKLAMPVLMMTGEHDRLAPPHEIRAVAGRIAAQAQGASVRFEIIPGAGHVCNVERPDVYNALLIDFLRETGA